MTDVYEFHVAGSIGPVVRGALGDLSADDLSRESVLTGVAQSPSDLADLLQRLDASGLVPTQIRICPHTRWHGGSPEAPAVRT